MIGYSPNPEAIALRDLPRDRREIPIELWPHRLRQQRPLIRHAENDVHQHERERLRHRSNLAAILRRTPSHLCATLLLAIASFLAHAQTSTTPLNPGPPPGTTQPATAPQLPLQPHTIRIRILNARTSQPITNERLNVALSAAQIGSVAMATDRNGIILVDTGTAATVRVLSNMYADCRPRGELYTDYPLATILSTGITAGNLCSPASRPPRPGQLTLFEIPRTFIPKAGDPPNTTLPHSDEYPQ